jgi:hypothetical protein
MSLQEGFPFRAPGINSIKTNKGGKEGDILEWPVKRQPGGEKNGK